MAEEFKAGDVVMVKSGGPQMTVAGVGQYGMVKSTRVKCVWFEGAKREESLFEPALLKKVE